MMLFIYPVLLLGYRVAQSAKGGVTAEFKATM
jgi:hypothetical protein